MRSTFELVMVLLLHLFPCYICNTCWGYQIDGDYRVIDIDQDGDVYFVDPYFITKISSSGDHLWTYSWKYDLFNQRWNGGTYPKLGFGKNSVYITSHSIDLVLKLSRDNGQFIWKQSISFNDDSNTEIQDIVADEDDDLYILFLERTLFRNFLKKLDGKTATSVWELPITNYTSESYHTLSLKNGLIEVKGSEYDKSKSKTIYKVKVLATETGKLLSTSYLDSPYREKHRYEAFYEDDHYEVRTTNRHEYGTNISVMSGSVINKNRCKDGYYLKPATLTTSYQAECPGLSWSKGHFRFLVCTYYYGRVNTVGIGSFYVFPLLLIMWFSHRHHLSAVQILSSILFSFAFSSDLSYIFSVVFYNLLLFGLALGFLLLPSIHLLEYLRRAKKEGNRKVAFVFSPPRSLTPFIVVSSRDGVPYFREFRCLPNSFHPSEDLLLLVGGWILAFFAQILYSILWINLTLLFMIPWLVVHLPWFLVTFLWGYLLYRIGLLQNKIIREGWVDVTLSPYSLKPLRLTSATKTDEGPESYQDVPAIKHDSSWDIVVSSIFVFLFSFIGELVVQSMNNKRMHYSGIVASLSLISKSLFLLNILNRLLIHHGPLIFFHIRHTLFPNFVSSGASFIPLPQPDSDPFSSPSSSQLRIEELELEISTLRTQLSRYQQIHDSSLSTDEIEKDI